MALSYYLSQGIKKEECMENLVRKRPVIVKSVIKYPVICEIEKFYQKKIMKNLMILTRLYVNVLLI